MTETIHVFKLIRLLTAGAEGGMVSHKRCENAESQPAEHEILCGICSEAAKISTGIQETAHVQGWKHMKVQKDMGPPGFVVTHPDTAVTVHADIGRTGEHQDPFIRL